MGTTTKRQATKPGTNGNGKLLKLSPESSSKGKIDLLKALQENFGFDKFKGNQQKAIESVLAGRDTFVIMPTGGGKSLCYQLPAILCEGVAIIISPLIALMKNQVDLVRSYSSKDEVAHFLNSSVGSRNRDSAD